MVVYKIAGIVLKDKKFLAVKKRDLNILITPGGKVESGEKPQQALERELKEELNVKLISMKPFGIFKDKMPDGKEDLILETYFAEIEGEPQANSEIEDIFWAQSDFKHPEVELSMPIKRHIVPKLVKMKLIY